VLFQVNSSATTDAKSQTDISQGAFVSNVVLLPIQAPGSPFSQDALNGNARKK